ncbi:hypothetical protein ACLB2K_016379 [Fragaria x ananassa]
MEIELSYFEVMDVVSLFEHLNNNCEKELEAVGKQYPFEPLKYFPETLRLTFQEGVQMLKDAGVEVDPMEDLNTAKERSNSFDVVIRGEEIISGAQRIHSAKFLTERAKACGIEVETISPYIDSFRYGVPAHGGFGVGLERVVMLFCGLNNIRKTSLFLRDPKWLTP